MHRSETLAVGERAGVGRNGHRPQVRALDGMEGLDPERWDALVPPGHGPLRHGFLSAWQHAELPRLRWRVLTAYDGQADGPAAAAPGYFYDLDAGVVQRLPGIVRALRRRLPGLFTTRVYELGSPAPLLQPLLTGPSLPTSAAADALVRAAMDEAGDGGADMVIVQNFRRDDEGAARNLTALGFSRVPVPPTVVLDLPFGSFDEYLSAMRAPYRRRARRVLEQSSHLRAERLDDFAGLAPELARQVRLVFERATEVRRETLPGRFFAAASGLADTSVLALCRPDGSIAAFALLQRDDPWLHFLVCGFEQRAGVEEGAYFRLLYEIARTAIDWRLQRVDLGVTTVEPKLDVGGTAVPLAAWIRHRHRLVQRVFERIAAGPLAPAVAGRRRVFKRAPG